MASETANADQTIGPPKADVKLERADADDIDAADEDVRGFDATEQMLTGSGSASPETSDVRRVGDEDGEDEEEVSAKCEEVDATNEAEAEAEAEEECSQSESSERRLKQEVEDGAGADENDDVEFNEEEANEREDAGEANRLEAAAAAAATTNETSAQDQSKERATVSEVSSGEVILFRDISLLRIDGKNPAENRIVI